MSSTRGQHLVGKVLGSCLLEKVLGYGGSSAVFLAQQHNPERKVAIKVFLPRSNMDKQMQKEYYNRFLREAEAASQLDHPNILPIYSYGEQDGLPYIVMPYMPGGTLSEYIARNGALSLEETQWYLEQIASALDCAHDHHYIHCDVKPANILLDNEGRAMLSDFGIARPSKTNGAKAPKLSRSSDSLMGTPDYIPPEQALGQELGRYSDIYSLGITVFFLLAGKLPFVADTTIALALLHIHEPPPSLALVRADVSPAIDQVIHKALAKEPEKRYQTVGEFSFAFGQAVDMTEKMYLSEINGKRARIAGAKGESPHDEVLPTLLAADPVVRVKPAASRKFLSLRLIVAASLVFAVLVAGIFSASIFASWSGKGGTPNVSSISTGVKGDNPGNDRLSEQENWPTSSNLFFDDQTKAYHIVNNSPQYVAMAIYNGHQYDNFQISITMSKIRGPEDDADYYGIIFRSTLDQSHYYLFEVVNADQGAYAFSRYDNGQWKNIDRGAAPSLILHQGKPNVVTIDARDNTFKISINGKALGKTIIDSMKNPLKRGLVGLYVEEQGAEVAFSRLFIHPYS